VHPWSLSAAALTAAAVKDGGKQGQGSQDTTHGALAIKKAVGCFKY
jgi:hypothetical protein